MSNASRTAILIVVAALAGSVVGIFVFIEITGGSGTPSGETVAPTLDPNAIPTLSASQSFALVTRAAELEKTVTAQAAAIAALETAATATAIPPATATALPATEAPHNRVLYRITAGGASEARFFLQEDLRGVRTDVIGRTDQVAGDVVIDFMQPALSQVGVIRTNARTLATNDDRRNSALRSRILRSAQDEYEYIEFAPESLNGLPESIDIGTSYSLEIEGLLTLVGQALPVVFRGEATLESEETLRGEFTARLRYADWGIVIPNLPFIANVDEEVELSLSFVAERVVERVDE